MAACCDVTIYSLYFYNNYVYVVVINMLMKKVVTIKDDVLLFFCRYVVGRSNYLVIFLLLAHAFFSFISSIKKAAAIKDR